MDLNYNILNIITLFGAIQGFILCVFIYQKKFANKLAVNFFLLFLFSLSFYNLIYALLDMNVFQYYRPLHMFPYPYKWLIGAGFYFYIKNQFQSKDGTVFHKTEWYFLAPAVLYGLLRTYWFSIAVSENSFRITKVIVDSDFELPNGARIYLASGFVSDRNNKMYKIDIQPEIPIIEDEEGIDKTLETAMNWLKQSNNHTKTGR